MDKLPIIGHTYQHYKGKIYTVVGIGKIESDLSDAVIYQDDSGQIWIRPLDNFTENVKIDGNRTIPRFKIVE